MKKKLLSVISAAVLGAVGLTAPDAQAFQTDDYGFLVSTPRASARAYCPPNRVVAPPIVATAATPVVAMQTTVAPVQSAPTQVVRSVTSLRATATARPVERVTLLPRVLGLRR